MKFYSGQYFSDYSDEIKNRIKSEINAQEEAYILNVNEDDYCAYLTPKFEVDTPEINFDAVFVDSVEKDIPGSRFPRHSFWDDDELRRMYRREVIVYHLPYSGDLNLMSYKPNPRAIMTCEFEVDYRQKCILIDVINFYNDPKRIADEYNREVNSLKTNYENLRKNCETHNKGLESFIRSAISTRREQFLKKNNLLSSLGVPLKVKESTPKTFSVPNPQLKEKVIVKPIVVQKDFKPEPTLDASNYSKILKIINDVGKNFERMPATYKGKTEEDLRDHILLILDPNFEYGSAGGETFNSTGKTDISLRYDSSVVFIAECKYWKGESTFQATINQLLGYLTWRDSKVAIINFVQNKEFSDILSKIKISIKNHPNFLKELDDSDDTWFNYKFHLNGDRNREIQLAIISFHLPKQIQSKKTT